MQGKACPQCSTTLARVTFCLHHQWSHNPLRLILGRQIWCQVKQHNKTKKARATDSLHHLLISSQIVATCFFFAFYFCRRVKHPTPPDAFQGWKPFFVFLQFWKVQSRAFGHFCNANQAIPKTFLKLFLIMKDKKEPTPACFTALWGQHPLKRCPYKWQCWLVNKACDVSNREEVEPGEDFTDACRAIQAESLGEHSKQAKHQQEEECKMMSKKTAFQQFGQWNRHDKKFAQIQNVRYVERCLERWQMRPAQMVCLSDKQAHGSLAVSSQS